jgi:hypothetical protein
LTDPAPTNPSTPAPAGGAAPTITATAGYVITGAGFLPDHDITIRVTYTAEDISDHLTYTTGPGGDLYAELPTSPATGVLHITATDHRKHPDGTGGLLWSNTQTVQPLKDWLQWEESGRARISTTDQPDRLAREASPRAERFGQPEQAKRPTPGNDSWAAAAEPPRSQNSGSQAEALWAIAAALERLADVIFAALNPAEATGRHAAGRTSDRDE